MYRTIARRTPIAGAAPGVVFAGAAYAESDVEWMFSGVTFSERFNPRCAREYRGTHHVHWTASKSADALYAF